MSSENFMRIVDALEIPLSYLLYEKLNEIPLTELVRVVIQNFSKTIVVQFVFEVIG